MNYSKKKNLYNNILTDVSKLLSKRIKESYSSDDAGVNWVSVITDGIECGDITTGREDDDIPFFEILNYAENNGYISDNIWTALRREKDDIASAYKYCNKKIMESELKFKANKMSHKEKKSLYENIMKEVSKTVKKHINEQSSSPIKVWDADISYDSIAHLLFGWGLCDCEADDIKVVRKEMRDVIDIISTEHKNNLNKLGISVLLNKRSGIIHFDNITESNIIEFTSFLTEILNRIGEAYFSDFTSCINYSDIVETLEENDPKKLNKFERMLEKSLFF